jgi:hypothetical protein
VVSRYRAEYDDPTGQRHGGLPTYPWRMAPDGLATRRQLRAAGLQPGGRPPVAQLMWHGLDPASGKRGPRYAWLYDIAQAVAKRPATAGQLRAVEAMLTARRTCDECRVTYEYCLPRTWGGICPACAGMAGAA